MAPIKVKKPEAIFFDLSGTATKSYFTDKILFPYIKQNCLTFLQNNWDNQVLQRDVERLREQSKNDGPLIANFNSDRSEIQDSICKYVCQSLDELRDNDAINIFRLHMWFDGYERDKIETPVYSDVAIQIKQWRCIQQIKLYVLSNGWVEATKRFMAKTNHGDLNLLIDGHFDCSIGSLECPDTYVKVCQKVSLPIDKVLFLTKSFNECNAAKKAGMNSILVMTHRRDLLRLDEKEKQAATLIRSFNEITFIGCDSTYPSDMSGASLTVTSKNSKEECSNSIKMSSYLNSKASSSTASGLKTSSRQSSAHSSSKPSSSATRNKISSNAVSSNANSSTKSSSVSASQTSSKQSSAHSSSKPSSSATRNKISSNAVSSNANSSTKSSSVSASQTSSKRSSAHSSSKPSS